MYALSEMLESAREAIFILVSPYSVGVSGVWDSNLLA